MLNRASRWKFLLPAAMLLVLLAVAPVFAADDAPPSINVTGTGTVTIQPDQATVDLSVVTVSPLAKNAQEENAAKMNSVIEALLKAGINRENIQTSGYTIWPEYNYGEKREKPEIIGYQVRNQLHVKATPAQVGTVIDTAVQSGVNQVENVSFFKDDPATTAQQALQKACLQARAKAQAIAAALGVELGGILNVNESQSYDQPPILRMAADSAVGGMGGTPIQPGELKIISNVAISFAIK